MLSTWVTRRGCRNLAAGRASQRRQGRRAQRGHQLLAARSWSAWSTPTRCSTRDALLRRVPPVRRRPRPRGRRRGRGPGRQRLARRPRPGHRRPDAARLAGPDPGRGVPPRVPDRPRRLVADGRAADHLRRVRHLPQGCAARAWAGWPPTASARTPSWWSASTGCSATSGATAGSCSSPEPVAWTEAPGGPRGAAQAAAPLAPRPDRDPRPARPDDVPPALRRRSGWSRCRGSWSSSCSRRSWR